MLDLQSWRAHTHTHTHTDMHICTFVRIGTDVHLRNKAHTLTLHAFDNASAPSVNILTPHKYKITLGYVIIRFITSSHVKRYVNVALRCLTFCFVL